jgi:B12-binding domain/radical SAM domain protein
VQRQPLHLVVNYKRTNTYGHHTVLGALEAIEPPRPYTVEFATGTEAVEQAIESGLESADRVLVCWSFYSPAFLEAAAELRELRWRRPPSERVVHIAGGVHASAEPVTTLQAGFDLVAVGEGETTFARLVAALQLGDDVDGVPGLRYLLDDGTMVDTGPTVREELDAFPAFAHRLHKYNPIEITRGCIYSCKFCQTPFMFKARFRHRSVDNIVQHVKVMKDRGLTDVRFITPTSLSYGSQDESVNLEAIEDLLSRVRGAVGDSGKIFFGSFPSEVRPEHVTPESLRLLKRYVNNDNLIIGAQSGSERVLESSNRGHDVQSIDWAVGVAVQEGFLPNVDFIFGLPGEEREDAQESLELAERLAGLGARIHGHTFMPLPGTPYSDSPPGKVQKSTLKALRRLESRGKLYGQWQKQEQVAADLVDVVRREQRVNIVRRPSKSDQG